MGNRPVVARVKKEERGYMYYKKATIRGSDGDVMFCTLPYQHQYPVCDTVL